MKFIPLILSIILFLGLSGTYGFLVSSIQHDVDTAGVFLEQSESLTRRDALTRSLELFLNDTENERSALSGYVYGTNDVVSAIELIEDTARGWRVDVSISNVDVRSEEGWSEHEMVRVSFSASGTFSRMTSFISYLESLPTASRLETVSLEASDGGEWFGTFIVSFVKEK